MIEYWLKCLACSCHSSRPFWCPCHLMATDHAGRPSRWPWLASWLMSPSCTPRESSCRCIAAMKHRVVFSQKPLLAPLLTRYDDFEVIDTLDATHGTWTFLCRQEPARDTSDVQKNMHPKKWMVSLKSSLKWSFWNIVEGVSFMDMPSFSHPILTVHNCPSVFWVGGPC